MKNSLPIRFPENADELPSLTVGHVLRNPFDMLEKTAVPEASGVNGTIAACIRDLHRKFRAVTLLFGEGASLKKLLRHGDMIQRMRGSPYFTLDERGSRLAIADPETNKLTMVYDFDFGQELHADKLEMLYGSLADQERRALPDLVQCEENALLLGIGAGVGYENPALAEHARARGAFFICHDLLPGIVKAARSRPPLKNLPYVIVPPLPQFLAPLLQSHPGPRHIVGTNVLSILKNTDIDQLIESAALGGADRVVFYQRNGLPDHHSLIPKEWWLAGPAFMKNLNTFYDEEIEAGRIGGGEIEGQNGLICGQAIRTFASIIWEALRRYTARTAAAHGYRSTVLRLHQEMVLEDAQALDAVHSHVPPSLNGEESFGDRFNEIHSGVLRERYGMDPELPPSNLRVTLNAFALALTREGSAWAPPAEISCGTVTELRDGDPLLPPDPWNMLDDRHRWIGEENDPEHRIRKTTARVVHRIIFEKIVRQPGCNLFAALDPDDREELAAWCKAQFCPN